MKLTKKNRKKMQILMMVVGAIMVASSYLIFRFSSIAYLNSIQSEFASAGIILILASIVWILTKKRIST